MKLIGTRIRVETSKHKAEYFPEYCLESKNWFGKAKQTWYGVNELSSHYFGEALRALTIKSDIEPRTQDWAKAVIDYQMYYYNEAEKRSEHANTKQTAYVKYP